MECVVRLDILLSKSVKRGIEEEVEQKVSILKIQQYLDFASSLSQFCQSGNV